MAHESQLRPLFYDAGNGVGYYADKKVYDADNHVVEQDTPKGVIT